MRDKDIPQLDGGDSRSIPPQFSTLAQLPAWATSNSPLS